MKSVRSTLCRIALVCLLFSSINSNAQGKVELGFKAIPSCGEAPLEVSFIDQTPNGTTEWYWTLKGGKPETSNYKNPSVIYEKPGTYDVQLIAKTINGYDTFIMTDFIEVKLGKPVANFTASTTRGQAPLKIDFEDKSTNSPSAWVWEFAGGIPKSSNKQSPRVTYYEPGKYTVKLLASNENGATQVEKVGFIQVFKINGIAEAKFNEVFELYPNPATTVVNLNVKVPGYNKVQIFDMQGKYINSEDISEDKLAIDISDYKKGLYNLFLYGEEGKVNTKLLIK